MSFPKYDAYKDSGVEWLGDVPAHWTICALTYRYSVQLSKMLDEKRITGAHLGPYLRNVDVQWGRINVMELPEMDFRDDDLARFSLLRGDLLVCEGGEVGRAAIWNGEIEPCFYQKALHRLRPDRAQNDNPAFLFYVMLAAAKLGVFAGSEGKATIVHLPAETLRRYRFPFPPYPEQAAIAAFLDREAAKIDALVEEQQRLIALLKEKRQAVISHAVTKGLDPNAPMKPSGLRWPDQVPAHWEVLSLTRVVRQFVDYRGATPNKVEVGIPLITATQIKNGRIDHALDPVFITEEEYAERMTRGFPEVGDVLLTTEAPLGETAQIEEEKVAPGQRIILMKPELNKVTKRYLFTHFRSLFGQNELWTRASGSTASGIRADRLRGSAVLVPPVSEQEAIVAHVDASIRMFEPIERALEEQIVLLQERRSALISAAVTGKIDVRGLAPEAAEAA